MPNALAVLDLNALRGFLAEANGTFQVQEAIAYGDPRQTCLNDFVLFLLARFQGAGVIDTAEKPGEI